MIASRSLVHQLSQSPKLPGFRGLIATPFVVSIMMLLTSGCASSARGASVAYIKGGHVSEGKQLIVKYRCGACHTIPGISNAHGVFGPPLTAIAKRSYIAGMFPNLPENLVNWIENPKAMKPKTAMPNLGMSQQQARDITAYLETLR